jgi:putative SOS response-associated peptidase YedK
MNTYSIITVEANEFVSHIHNTKKRMPLILEPDEALQWIDNELSEEGIKSLMKPFDSSRMKAHTVQKFVPVKPGNKESKEIIAYYYYPELVDLFESNL